MSGIAGIHLTGGVARNLLRGTKEGVSGTEVPSGVHGQSPGGSLGAKRPEAGDKCQSSYDWGHAPMSPLGYATAPHLSNWSSSDLDSAVRQNRFCAHLENASLSSLDLDIMHSGTFTLYFTIFEKVAVEIPGDQLLNFSTLTAPVVVHAVDNAVTLGVLHYNESALVFAIMSFWQRTERRTPSAAAIQLGRHEQRNGLLAGSSTNSVLRIWERERERPKVIERRTELAINGKREQSAATFWQDTLTVTEIVPVWIARKRVQTEAARRRTLRLKSAVIRVKLWNVSERSPNSSTSLAQPRVAYDIFGPGRRVPKSHSSCSCCSC